MMNSFLSGRAQKIKTTKGYGISIDGYPGEEYVFFNEDERNEMALALYDELVYELWGPLFELVWRG